MHLQVLEILVGLQVGIILLDGNQLTESRSEFTLSLLELFQFFGRHVFGVERHLRGLRTSIDDVFERLLFVLGIAFHRFHEVGNEVGTTLIGRLHVSQFGRGFLLHTHH